MWVADTARLVVDLDDRVSPRIQPDEAQILCLLLRLIEHVPSVVRVDAIIKIPVVEANSQFSTIVPPERNLNTTHKLAPWWLNTNEYVGSAAAAELASCSDGYASDGGDGEHAGVKVKRQT